MNAAVVNWFATEGDWGKALRFRRRRNQKQSVASRVRAGGSAIMQIAPTRHRIQDRV